MLRFCKRGSAFALAAVMLLSVAANGLEIRAQGADTGLCVHHTEHTPDCGYAAAAEGQECRHVHDASCYQCSCGGEDCAVVLTCTDAEPEHAHDASCYTCACASCQAEGAEAPTIALDCRHVHDQECGYAEAAPGTPCTYAENGCPWCVSEWRWIDEAQLLTDTADGWELLLPGVGQENPLTAEALAAMLPGRISAVTESGDTVTLSVIWDLTDLPGSMTEGTYALTAALAATPEAYALTEEAIPLSVTVRLGGAETYGSDVPSGTPPYEDHVVQGVSPKGTTINLFDYWLEGRTSRDTYNPDEYQNLGINKDHALLFTYQMKQPANQSPANKDPVGDWNGWTRGTSPYTGMVQDQLVNGYPALDLGTIENTAATSYVAGRNGQESLAYLFDPDVASVGKAGYENVQGLLQVDDEGYYYYDSQENYAVYYADTNSFVLYDRPGVIKGNSQSEAGQFFPFNEANNDPSENDSGLMRTNKSTAADMNHYFGLHMSTRFVQQNGGYVDESKTTPVTYEFSGDDDVWIFIDGKLAVDLGGLHNRASVTINFATGEIKINDKKQTQTLGQVLGTGSATLPDDTYHTLDFFYLERGNTDSNLKLRYNLVTIPESDLVKVDQLGNAIEGAEFALYGAADYEKNSEQAAVIASGTTDVNGGFIFQRADENGNYYPVTIDRLYSAYKDSADSTGNNLILVETDTPDGYRSVGEVGLYFYAVPNSDEVLLLSNSTWDKGAYAMPKVTATLPNAIQLLETATGTAVTNTVTLTGAGAVENPLLFAVVYQKQEDGTWLPVSGDPINGWTVQDNNNWTSVIAAANKNPYIFQPASSGAYQVEIDNLPGDIKTYYHLTGNIAVSKYTVAYYYSTADELKNATAGNTWRIKSDDTDDAHSVDRVFAVRLYVPNIKNYLLVQKVNASGDTLTDATFELYQAEDVTVNQDGSVAVKDDADAYDTLTTTDRATAVAGLTLQGGGIFPASRNVLANGEYYLLETTAPDGYETNDTAIHIVVDNTGVYADAGTADDGVEVLRGVGSVVKSMVQFAVNDKVDTTLNGIKAALVTSTTYDETNGFTWTDAEWNETQGTVLHLQYHNQHNTLDYGPYDTDTSNTLTLSTDVGWTKLLIRQCYQHGSNEITALKQNLDDADITNLFSGTCTVRVTDNPVIPDTGSLTVSKTVTGEGADLTKGWTFTVELKNGNDALSGTYSYTGDVLSGVTGVTAPAGGTLTFGTDGQATFTLTHGQSITVTGLPAGTSYAVTEGEAGKDGYTTSFTGETGEITKGQTKTAAFTNHKGGTISPPAEQAGSLTVTKTVTGTDGDQARAWTFTVTLTGTGAADVDGTYGDMTFTGGVAAVRLKHNESVTATGLPAGLTYTVTEYEANQGGYTTKSNGADGTIPANGTATAAFVNARTAPENPGTSPDGPNTPPDEPDTPPDEPETSPDEPETSPDEPDTPPDGPDTLPDESDTTADEPNTLPDGPGTPLDEPDTLPDEPDTSVVPEAPGDPGTPQTGDSSLTALWALLCAGSLAGLFLSVRKKLSDQGKHVRKS